MSESNNNRFDPKSVPTAAMCAADKLWDPRWVEGEGEKTIAKRSAVDATAEKKKRTLYCSWFCPFAQRAWIALEELGEDYRYVEVNPYRVDLKQPGGYTKKSLSLAEKREQMPDFIASSPRGLVPALVDQCEGRDDIIVWESSTVVEYLSESVAIDNKNGGKRLLLPTDPHLRALVRIWVDHCTSRIQKAYYTFLMGQSQEAQEAAKVLFFDECRALASAMAPASNNPEHPLVENIVKAAKSHPKLDVDTVSSVMCSTKLTPGPYFLGDQFSAVDAALAPFWQRFLWVGGHYRGLKLPENDAAFRRLNIWWEAVSSRPSVRATFVCKDRLICSYSDYARNVATSDFAVGMQSSLASK